LKHAVERDAFDVGAYKRSHRQDLARRFQAVRVLDRCDRVGHAAVLVDNAFGADDSRGPRPCLAATGRAQRHHWARAAAGSSDVGGARQLDEAQVLVGQRQAHFGLIRRKCDSQSGAGTHELAKVGILGAHHARVGKPDVGAFQVTISAHELRLGGRQGRGRGGMLGLGAITLAEQLLGAIEFDLALPHQRLRLVDGHGVIRGIDAHEHLLGRKDTSRDPLGRDFDDGPGDLGTQRRLGTRPDRPLAFDPKRGRHRLQLHDLHQGRKSLDFFLRWRLAQTCQDRKYRGCAQQDGQHQQDADSLTLHIDTPCP
jgi:hypothetical protein